MNEMLPEKRSGRSLQGAQHAERLPALIPLGSDGDYQEVKLREYIRVLYKYRMLVFASVALCFLLSFIYAFTATPLYTAQSKLRIATYAPVLTATKIEDLLQERSKESTYLDTQIEELRSYSLVDQILQDPTLKNALFPAGQSEGIIDRILTMIGAGSDDEDKIDSVSGYKTSIRKIKRYLKRIEIQPIRRTSLVILQATSSNPSVAALMANKHAATYIDWVRNQRVKEQSNGLVFLNQQAEELKQKVADLEREIADYAEANSIVAVNKDENITVQKMAQLNKLLTDATSQRIEAENLYKEAEASLQNPSAGFDDISTQTMRSELAKLEAEYGQLSSKFTSSYPRMQQLKAQIDELKESIVKARKQVVLGLKAKALAAEQAEKNMREELDQQKSQAFELSKREVQYNILNRELTSSRELLQNVLKQIKETSLSVESNATNVSVVDYAITPTIPTYPNKLVVVLLGGLFGLAVGVGIAFLLRHLDNSVRTPEQLNNVLKLACLGVVPSFESEKFVAMSTASDAARNQNKPAEGAALAESELPAATGLLPSVVFVNSPKSLAAEAYRTIRTGILLSQAGQPPRTILVTSAQSSEGKTTLSVNLAVSLASAGGRVVLVDADLRRPKIVRYFNLDAAQPGLVEVLTGQAALESVSRKTPIDRLEVIGSGNIPPNPAELLGSIEMASVLDALSQQYDYVIIDSPPVLPVTDSVIMARCVDGVVLVVKGGATPRKVAQDAKTRLVGVGARILGVALNNVNIRGGDYYYYNRYYYSYYNNEEELNSRAAG